MICNDGWWLCIVCSFIRYSNPFFFFFFFFFSPSSSSSSSSLPSPLIVILTTLVSWLWFACMCMCVYMYVCVCVWSDLLFLYSAYYFPWVSERTTLRMSSHTQTDKQTHTSTRGFNFFPTLRWCAQDIIIIIYVSRLASVAVRRQTEYTKSGNWVF